MSVVCFTRRVSFSPEKSVLAQAMIRPVVAGRTLPFYIHAELIQPHL